VRAALEASARRRREPERREPRGGARIRYVGPRAERSSSQRNAETEPRGLVRVALSPHRGFVFQFYNLIPSLTARENVALVTDIADRPMRPEEALAMVGLEERMDHFPAQLSGGEQQRVAIARAIAKRPDVLLCDEPTGALDIRTGKLVLEAIARVNEELGTAAVVITHNAVIAGMADRVITVAGGGVSGERMNATRAKVAELSW
jgi:putative ABC transport system ATP-binding protein